MDFPGCGCAEFGAIGVPRILGELLKTAHPTAEWAAQRRREPFPFDEIPQYRLREWASILAAL